MYATVLAELGFQPDPSTAARKQADADDPNTDGGDMSHNGKYEILGVWTKGDVCVHLERNTAREDDADMSAVVTHPPLLVVEKGNQRLAAVSPRDLDALRAVLTEIS